MENTSSRLAVGSRVQGIAAKMGEYFVCAQPKRSELFQSIAAAVAVLQLGEQSAFAVCGSVATWSTRSQRKRV